MPRLVLVALIVAFLPALSASVVPSHDALQIYTTFWTYISGLVTEGRLPEWIPFSRYGTPSSPILMYVSPMGYLTGAAGAVMHKLWGFNDTLLLFKIAVFLEYALFAAGLLRFGKLLFHSAWVNGVIAIAAILASPWIVSLDGNFHAFYMTPWILAELAQALESGRGKHLGRAALLSVFACVGNVPYFPPFLLLQLFVFSIPLAITHRQQLKPLLLNARTWLWLGLAAALAGIHFVALVKGMEGLAIFSAGRDPVTNRVPLPVFLTYAGVAKPLHLLDQFVFGRCINGDNTFYMGLGPLVLLPLSFLVRPTPLLRAIQTLAVFVLLFSAGGLVATAAYYFPGMAFYRHVSIVYGLFRLLGLFCAGYVIDRCLADRSALSEWRARLVSGLRQPLVLLAIAVGLFDLIRAQLSGPSLQLVLLEYWPLRDPIFFRLLGYVLLLWLAYRLRPRRLWPALLMTALIFDLGTFWGAGWFTWPRLNEQQTANMAVLAAPRKLANPGPRFVASEGPVRAPRFGFIATTVPLRLPISALYVHTYFWAGEDPCVPRLRTDFLAAPVARFFEQRGVPFAPTDATEQKVLQDPVLAGALACRQPRVVSAAQTLNFTRGYDWIRMTLHNPQPAPVALSISEAMHEGWTATVDGAAAKIVPRHDAFLGTMIPPGRHDVAFRFHLPLAGPLRAAEGVIAALAALWLSILSLRALTVSK